MEWAIAKIDTFDSVFRLSNELASRAYYIGDPELSRVRFGSGIYGVRRRIKCFFLIPVQSPPRPLPAITHHRGLRLHSRPSDGHSPFGKKAEMVCPRLCFCLIFHWVDGDSIISFHLGWDLSTGGGKPDSSPLQPGGRFIGEGETRGSK